MSLISTMMRPGSISTALRRHAWLLAPFLVAATCATLALTVDLEGWVDFFRHPGRDPLPPTTRQGAVWWRAMLGVGAAALIAAPLALVALAPRPSSRPERQPPCRRRLAGLLGLLAVALLLRSLRLGESLWYDEIVAWRSFGFYGPGPIIGNYFDPANHVAHTLASFWSVGLLGAGELGLRAPALLASLGSVVAVHALARPVFGARVALVAAALMAVLPVSVLEGVEARGYSMMILGSAAATWALLAAWHDPRPWRWCLYSGVVALGAWAHPMTVFVGLGHAVWIAWRALADRSAGWALPLSGAVALGLAAVMTATLYSPALPDALGIRATLEATGADHQPSLLGAEGVHAVLGLGGSWYGWAAAGGLLLGAVGLAAAVRDAGERRVVAAALLGLPLFAVSVAVLDTWMYARFTLFAFPGAVLLMARGIEVAWRRKRVLGLVVLGLLAAFGGADLGLRPAKQPLREAAEYVRAAREPDERVLVIGLGHRVMDAYGADLGLAYSLRHGVDLAEKLRSVDPVWVILYYPAHVAADRYGLLAERGYRLQERFRGWVDWGNGDVLVYEKRGTREGRKGTRDEGRGTREEPEAFARH